MPTLTAYGTIKDGKLFFSNRKRFDQDLSEFRNCGVEITIKKKARRSNPQNRYYWGIVIKEIQLRLNELGNDFTPELVHEFLKDKFNKKELIGDGGEVIDFFGGSTTEMNKDDFGLYIDKIAMWANDFLGIYIPQPNEKLTLSL